MLALLPAGIIYDVIVEPPSVGSMTDEHGHQRPVAFLAYRSEQGPIPTSDMLQMPKLKGTNPVLPCFSSSSLPLCRSCFISVLGLPVLKKNCTKPAEIKKLSRKTFKNEGSGKKKLFGAGRTSFSCYSS